MRNSLTINWLALFAVIIVAATLCAVAISRVTIDTDIVRSLPAGDPVIADGITMFEKNPVKDQIAIDIGVADGDLDVLVAAAEVVEAGLAASQLFAQVGNRPIHEGLTRLADHVVHQLPTLFTETQLRQQVAPLLADQQIRDALIVAKKALYRMEGIGQAATLAADPLGLRNLVLAHLANLNPAPGATIHRGRILSADRRHLLVLATPAGSGTDTGVARRLTALFAEIDTQIQAQFAGRVTLTPTGAYRAALDNETMIKGDVHRAVLWATIGIAALLLAAFARPLTGLLALLPALIGTVMAFFVFSLLRESVSVMVLGFGGAIISITVDHGIAYMLFVDSDSQHSGQKASHEIRSVGLLAVLTSVGAFSVLAFSGFAVFEQLGLFTAMGIGFAFLFVHSVLPRIIKNRPTGRPAAKRRFTRLVDRLAGAGTPGLLAALVVAALLAGFIRPHFNTELKTMNSVSPATRQADAHMAAVWGDIFTNVYLLTEAPDITALQATNDQLLEQLETESNAGAIAPPVSPALFYPGEQRRAENLRAWKWFWTKAHVERLTTTLRQEAVSMGFAPTAFDPFLRTLAADTANPGPIPASVWPLLGITGGAEGETLRQVMRVTPKEQFDGPRFFARIAPLATVFDPTLFSQRMGELLFSTFVKMLLIIGASLIVILLIFFADLKLLVIALLPLVFALVCTLGTLGLLGRPLDIPALMLAVIIFGMGVDYTLFLVRGYQRYQRFDHPHFAVVRTAIVMAACSTLVGFSVLLGAEHGLLQSAGLVSFLGIGFCLAGALLILPPLLKGRFETAPAADADPALRYANMEPHARMFARFKLRLDPLFDELPTMLPDSRRLNNILDVGCGFGVPACWMARHYPTAVLHGFDPAAERVRVAALALGERGRIQQGMAPDLPPMNMLLDLVTMLDMSHYLQDWELEKTLERIHERLLPDGHLVIRSVMPLNGKPHWRWHLERLKDRYHGLTPCHRDARTIGALLERCGYTIVREKVSGERQDMYWHVARPS